MLTSETTVFIGPLLFTFRCSRRRPNRQLELHPRRKTEVLSPQKFKAISLKKELDSMIEHPDNSCSPLETLVRMDGFQITGSCTFRESTPSSLYAQLLSSLHPCVPIVPTRLVAPEGGDLSVPGTRLGEFSTIAQAQKRARSLTS